MRDAESPVVLMDRLALQAEAVFESELKLHGPDYRFGGREKIRVAGGAVLTADLVLERGESVTVPGLVLEARRPHEMWLVRFKRMLDYLRAGVAVVVILDPKTESASIFRPGTRQEMFEKDQTLSLPDVLPGVAVPVARFFEE